MRIKEKLEQRKVLTIIPALTFPSKKPQLLWLGASSQHTKVVV